MASERIEWLFNACLQGKASENEQEEFLQFLLDPQNEREARELIQRAYAETKELTDLSAETSAGILKAIFSASSVVEQPKSDGAAVIPFSTEPVRKISGRWKKYIAAAAVILIAGAAFFMLYHQQGTKPQNSIVQQQSNNDIAPGGNKAILTLGNGNKIILDSAHNGLLAQQGGSKVIKTDSGKLAYNNISNEKPTATVYNVLSTPRGGQYQLTLPDGTKVWLNAASSIKYPTAFNGKDRTVEITGEAYFEVVHDAGSPFRVKAKTQVVEDLGTHFNIMAYDNEVAVVTTLLEGKIKIYRDKRSMGLTPGQQVAYYGENGGLVISKNPDLDQAIAWKNGLQSFSNADVQTIMREVERWYDVDVSYEGEIEKRSFNGDIPRSANLSEVLKLFDVNKIHFTIDAEKKKIVVRP
jgi:ferric-dicitrate binding protein FerR (iron transport regulator)